MPDNTPQQLKPQTIVITGGAGFLGSVLTKLLIDSGHRVIVIDKLLYDNQLEVELLNHPNLTFIQQDIREIVDFEYDFDAIIHLAAIVGDGAYAHDIVTARQINYEATLNLARLCKAKGIGRFLFASSCSVYGQNQAILTEKAALNPVSHYAADKMATERDLLALADDTFRPTILRMSTLYGASSRPRFDLVVNLLTGQAVTKNMFTVHGGTQWRPFLSLRDAAEAYRILLTSPLEQIGGQIYNVGSSQENYTIIQVGEAVARQVGGSHFLVDDVVGDQRDYKISFNKIHDQLGFTAQYTLNDGIREVKEAIIKNSLDITDRKYDNLRYLEVLQDVVHD